MNKSLLSLLFVICGAMTAGCSTNSSSKIHYYSFDNETQSSTLFVDIKHHDNKKYSFLVSKIDMPDYLDSQSIVYQVTDSEVIQTSNNRWVDKLSVILEKSLIELITNKIPDYVVLQKNICSGENCQKIFVRIKKFQGNYQGNAEVSFDWFLYSDNKLLCLGSQDNKQQLSNNGYPALVKALESSWDKGVDEMIQKVGLCSSDK